MKRNENHSRRVLATWHNEEGECFLHGMLTHGPSRPAKLDGKLEPAVYWSMSRNISSRDGMPRLTYGFRANGSDKYVSACELGFGSYASVAPHAYHTESFKVANFRTNQIKFYIAGGEELELPGSPAMYDLMIKDGWESREEWTRDIVDNVSRSHHYGMLQYAVTVGDVLDQTDCARASEMLKVPLMEFARSEKVNGHKRHDILEMWGVATHLHMEPYVKFDMLVRNFRSIAAHVTGADGNYYRELKFLEGLVKDGGEKYRKLTADRIDEIGGDKTNDEAWAREVERRTFLAHGNPADVWYQRQRTGSQLEANKLAHPE